MIKIEASRAPPAIPLVFASPEMVMIKIIPMISLPFKGKSDSDSDSSLIDLVWLGLCGRFREFEEVDMMMRLKKSEKRRKERVFILERKKILRGKVFVKISRENQNK